MEKTIETGIFDMEPIYSIFGSWMAMEDKTILDVLTAFWLAHRLGGDPIWLLVMGRSSDGKTELLRAFSKVDSIVAGRITSKTILSGKKKELGDIDEPGQFAKEINGKIWVVMDFSQILSLHPLDRKQIFSQMRDLFDGHLSARYGTGKKVQEEEIYTSFIGATTTDLEKHITEAQALGTRHLIVKMPSQDRNVLKEKINNHEGQEKRMRSALAATIMGSFADIKPMWITPDKETRDKIDQLVEILCTLRTFVSYHKEVDELPEEENIGRAKKNFDKFYAGLMNINSYTSEKALDRLAYIVRSNIPTMRLKVLEVVAQKGIINPSGLAKDLRIGYNTARRHIESLYSLKVLDKAETEMQREYVFSKAWMECKDWFKEGKVI